MKIESFKKIIWEHYRKEKRNLPWRKTKDPYKILVSEIMLQQTQSGRVVEKYNSFLKRFPSIKDLANSKLGDVLKEWQGLGYNRRAMYLKKCAEKIIKNYNGKFPKDLETLLTLPGIGRATAGDILAFAYNIPTVFIETNIRSVFIHFFFKNKKDVHDKEILQIVEETLDQENPREWYSALFDYGVKLKKEFKKNDPSKKSRHYKKQSKFEGSFRQKRAHVLRLILKNKISENEIIEQTKCKREEIEQILSSLEKEKMVSKIRGKYTIAL